MISSNPLILLFKFNQFQFKIKKGTSLQKNDFIFQQIKSQKIMYIIMWELSGIYLFGNELWTQPHNKSLQGMWKHLYYLLK